jgi:hypothetical protein
MPGTWGAEWPPTFWTTCSITASGTRSALLDSLHPRKWSRNPELELTKSVTAKYIGCDLILDLNDDTVFEIAPNQLARPFAYAPISRKK